MEEQEAASAGHELDEPKHGMTSLLYVFDSCSLNHYHTGTLESGHVYFMYRPKIDTNDVESIDDISK